MLRVNRLGNQVDGGLVSRQVALGRTGQTNGPVDNDLAVIVHQVAKLLYRKSTAMLCRSPVHHLVAHEDAQMLFELVSRLGQTACDGHHGTGKDTLRGNGAQQGLDVRREAEGHLLGVIEEGFGWVDGRDQFGTPDIARRARDHDLIGVPVAHVHNVGHERDRSVLEGKLAPEQPEVGEVGVYLLEVVQEHGTGHPFLLDGRQDLSSEDLLLIRRTLEIVSFKFFFFFSLTCTGRGVS